MFNYFAIPIYFSVFDTHSLSFRSESDSFRVFNLIYINMINFLIDLWDFNISKLLLPVISAGFLINNIFFCILRVLPLIERKEKRITESYIMFYLNLTMVFDIETSTGLSVYRILPACNNNFVNPLFLECPLWFELLR